jgi:hypothetical protein
MIGSTRNGFLMIYGPKKFETPIWIVGAPRSGTTLLNLHLAQGQSHEYFPECNVVSELVAGYARTSNLDASRFNAYFGSKDTAIGHYRSLIEQTVDLLLRNEEPRKYVTLKDPYLTLHTQYVKQLFPTAHIFMMYRPPGAVVASARKVSGRDDAEGYLRFYKAMQREAAALRNHPL